MDVAQRAQIERQAAKEARQRDAARADRERAQARRNRVLLALLLIATAVLLALRTWIYIQH